MNKERLLKVADAIENETLPNVTFAMETFSYKTKCGTAACIAGHALALYDPAYFDDMQQYADPEHAIVSARRILDLDTGVARALFYGRFSKKRKLENITREEAVAAIRQLAETGVITGPRGRVYTAGRAS